MDIKKQRGLTKTAHHEAGHAVVSFFLGVPFKYVTIIADEKAETLGHVRGWPMPKWFKPDMEYSLRLRERIDKEVMVFLAGYIAEKHYSKRGNNKWAGHDFSLATNLALYVNGGEKSTNAYIEWLMVRTEEMVTFDFRWKAIEAVVIALLDKKKLSSKEVKTIIQNSMSIRRK